MVENEGKVIGIDMTPDMVAKARASGHWEVLYEDGVSILFTRNQSLSHSSEFKQH